MTVSWPSLLDLSMQCMLSQCRIVFFEFQSAGRITSILDR